MTASATPRIDALLAAPVASSRHTGNLLVLDQYRTAGGRIMSDTPPPAVYPNVAGLELLHEIAQSQRNIEEHVGNLREGVALINGAELPARVTSIEKRLLAIETANAGAEGAARPFKFVLSKAVEQIITVAVSAAVAVGGTLAAMHGKAP